jgi:hypothetical protein
MAYLPMVQTGHGALTAEEVEHVRRGPFMVLPKDANGSTVVYTYRSRLDEYPGGRWQLVREIGRKHPVSLVDLQNAFN